MFVRVESRPRPHLPWATALMSCAILLNGIWQTRLESDARDERILRWGTVPEALLAFGQADGLDWWLEQPVRLVSTLFVHADWPHLIGNLLFLALFGLASEQRLGSLRFLLLFLICGAAANLCAALMLADATRPIVGSSGAVSAVMGAYLVLFPAARLNLMIPLGFYFEFVRVPALLLIGLWLMLQLTYTLVGLSADRVAWWAHLAGFVIGAVFALLSRPAVIRRLRD